MKNKIKILLITVLFLTIGCGKIEPKLLFSETELEELIEIGKIEESMKIFAKTEVYYHDKNQNIPFKESLKKKLISVEEIVSQMEINSALNDGGTVSFKYEKNKNNFANQDFF